MRANILSSFSNIWLKVAGGFAVAAVIGGAVAAQQNTPLPQPRADRKSVV